MNVNGSDIFSEHHPSPSPAHVPLFQGSIKSFLYVWTYDRCAFISVKQTCFWLWF